MLQKLRSQIKQKQTSVLIGTLVLLFLAVAGFGLFSQKPAVPPETEENVLLPDLVESEQDPLYSLDRIPDIEVIYRAINAHEPFDGAPSTNSTLRAVILPHHTLLGEQLADFWWDAKAGNSAPEVIVLMGPTHEDLGQHALQTTNGGWETPFGTVASGELTTGLAKDAVLAIEPDSFTNEHSIGAHIPYIAKLYPGTPVLPILARQTAAEAEVTALVDAIRAQHQNVLFVASIDFSHYLPEPETAFHDEITQDLIKKRDYPKIESLNSDYLDSPPALIAYLRWGEREECFDRQTWHESNYSLFDEKFGRGTSYFVYECTTDIPVVIHAAGDVMLGRGVESWVAKTTITEAFGKAADVFAGADIGFMNLESVLTSVEPSTGKSIHFKGKPERVDVLQLLGVTHVSVANNHVDDYGRNGWADSVQNVTNAGIVPVGGYRNDGEIVYAQAGKTRVALVAHDDTIFRVDEEVLRTEIAEAAANSDIVIASFHWGVEYAHTPTSRQVSLARGAIDAGADIILGTHPHVLQTVERYGDGIIFYSLGNFIFDQFGFDENETVIAKIEWSEGQRRVEFVPMRIKGGFPVPADEDETRLTLDRLAGWSDESLTEMIREGELVWE